MHTLHKAEQKRADKLSRDEAARELRNEQDSDGVCRQLKNALDPKDREPSKSRAKDWPRASLHQRSFWLAVPIVAIPEPAPVVNRSWAADAAAGFVL